MCGFGKMTYPDGTSYMGQWAQNKMNGDGVYVDAQKVIWEGIFVNNQYESKIQKILKTEKEQEDRCAQVKTSVIQWFVEYFFVHGRSDKKTVKDNMSPFFGTAENIGDYVTEQYSKFEDRTPDKWNDLLKNIFNDGKVQLKVLVNKRESRVVSQENILIDQMREKRGGQIVEAFAKVGDKQFQMAFCQLQTANWVIVICKEN